MSKPLIELVNELINLGQVAINISGIQKLYEPYVTITWRNDGTSDGEFYSYCLDLKDGGRHHRFTADHHVALTKELERLISEAKENIEQIGRMENEGG